MLNAAIVGLGRWGRALVKAGSASEKLRFDQAIDPDFDAARGFCDEQKLRLVADFDEMLHDPRVDAVVLATPHTLHKQQVLACAAAGKPVFCEKPLALKRRHAVEMFEACREARTVLAVGHNRRFWPSMTALRGLVCSGELGTILHVEGHNSNEHSKAIKGGWRLSPYESPLGGLTGAGMHVLDAFVSLVGPVRKVTTQFLSHSDPQLTLDTTSLMLEFKNGCSGFLATVRATPFYWRVHLFGTEGSAEVLGEISLQVRKSGREPEHYSFAPVDSVRCELDAFAEAVVGLNTYPIGADEILAGLAAFEAAIASDQSRCPVYCYGT